MDDVAIRKAQASDVAAIAAVHVAAWRETYGGLVPERLLSDLSVEERTRRWHRILTVPDASVESAVLVAVRPDQTVVGFGSCGRQRAAALLADGFAGEFSALYVLKAHQGQGVGRRLLIAMARDLMERGLRSAALSVLRENERARRFYEALGAQVIGARVETHGDVDLDVADYGWLDLRVLGP
jgi:ribosomal protein S18 acetylase RimI-like enzyme